MAETPAKAEVVALALRSPPWIIRFWALSDRPRQRPRSRRPHAGGAAMTPGGAASAASVRHQ